MQSLQQITEQQMMISNLEKRQFSKKIKMKYFSFLVGFWKFSLAFISSLYSGEKRLIEQLNPGKSGDVIASLPSRVATKTN